MGYRVVQWATGSMGKTSLRSIIDHPDLDLVGVYVYSRSKEGLDAGRIARRDETGVRATRDIDEILGLDADVVLHMPQLQVPYVRHAEDISRLLASGKNVITITSHHHPSIDSPTVVDNLISSATAGNATLFGTGVNPGMIMERLALAASGMCVSLDSLRVREVFDASGVSDHDYVFSVMGMGRRADQLDLTNGTLARLFRSQFIGTVGFVAHRMGLILDSVEAENSVTLAPRDIEVSAGVIPMGTVAATRWQLHGMVEERQMVTLDVHWTMAPALTGHDHDGHWAVSIVGKPGIEMRVDLVDPIDPMVRTKAAQYATVAPAILAIPDVCAAPPGLFSLPSSMPWRGRFTRP